MNRRPVNLGPAPTNYATRPSRVLRMKPAKYKIHLHVVSLDVIYLRGVNGLEIFSLVATSV